MKTQTTASGGVGLGRGGRMSRQRKRDAVLRLLRGEDLEILSRALGVTAATLSGWQDTFLSAGEFSLATRSTDGEALETERLKAKLGEMLLERELAGRQDPRSINPVSHKLGALHTGVRLHALVAIASALLVMLAGELGSGTPDHAAASRIIQGIVGGIGFLGAGVILRADKGNRVYHITTAATIWVTAALGTACGLGAWRVAALASVLVIWSSPLGLDSTGCCFDMVSRTRTSSILSRRRRPSGA